MTRSKQNIRAAGFLFLAALALLAAGCPSFPDKDFPDDDDAADDSGDDASDDTSDDTTDDTGASDDDLDDDTVASCEYSWDFESAAEGWTHGGTKDEWELGTPAYANGPAACHSDANCWGTDLDSDYDLNANNWLLSPLLNLKGNCRLTFWHWYKFAGIVDKGILEISSDGTTWENLRTYTATSDAWTQASVSLVSHTSYTYLRWHFSSDTALNAPGWYIDDVVISESE